MTLSLLPHPNIDGATSDSRNMSQPLLQLFISPSVFLAFLKLHYPTLQMLIPFQQ